MNTASLHRLLAALLALLLGALSPAALMAGGFDDDDREVFDSSSLSSALDSLLYETYFNEEYFSAAGDSTGSGFPAHFIPQFTDSLYAARIAELEAESPFKLTFNEHVKGFIRVYSVDKRLATARIIGLTSVYFPLFEEEMRKHGVPPEMKYLAVIESALNPTAVSRAGAMGLWQFMYGTGRLYGLESDAFVEDRFDPAMATSAAARHLRDLYRMYGDWFLALAAYNSGPGNVNKAIRRAGGRKDYWAIWKHLPAETRGYVPAFIAVNYIMHYYREHNIRPLEPGPLYRDVEELRVRRPVSFGDVAEALGLSEEHLRFLNPRYKQGVVPAGGERESLLRLPSGSAASFRLREEELYAMYRPSEPKPDIVAMGIGRAPAASTAAPASAPKVRVVTHRVRRGESVARIASRYGTTIHRIAELNGLGPRMEIKAGQRLRVERRGSLPGLSANGRFHRVQRGETLSHLARRYGVSVAQLADWNSLGRKRTIYPGQRLRVTPN